MDRPILMSGPMVRALLREIEQPGTGKTQTRRLAWRDIRWDQAREGDIEEEIDGRLRTQRPTIWQSVKAGDRLWVRETWLQWDWEDLGTEPNDPGTLRFLADGDIPAVRWRPSIHMPRWASRITLLVTATKREPVQEISEADARAEGVHQARIELAGGAGRIQLATMWTAGVEGIEAFSATSAYQSLWHHLHTKPGARWEDNAEVVAITFRPVLANIDAPPETA